MFHPLKPNMLKVKYTCWKVASSEHFMSWISFFCPKVLQTKLIKFKLTSLLFKNLIIVGCWYIKADCQDLAHYTNHDELSSMKSPSLRKLVMKIYFLLKFGLCLNSFKITQIRSCQDVVHCCLVSKKLWSKFTSEFHAHRQQSLQIHKVHCCQYFLVFEYLEIMIGQMFPWWVSSLLKENVIKIYFWLLCGWPFDWMEIHKTLTQCSHNTHRTQPFWLLQGRMWARFRAFWNKKSFIQNLLDPW